MGHEGDGDANCNWCTRSTPQMFDKWDERVKNRSKIRKHSNYSIFELGQNIAKKSLIDLRVGGLAVTQAQGKDYQLALV